MIEKILERLEAKAVVNPIGGKIVKYVCISDIIDAVREVEKEYSDASDNDLAIVSALPSLYPMQPFEEEAIHKVVTSAKDGEKEKIKMEFKENTHIVIKREDALKYLTEPEYQTLEELSHKIIRGRAKDNKTPCNSYYIVNHDEPYAEMVKGVIIGGEYAKSAPYQKGESHE